MKKKPSLIIAAGQGCFTCCRGCYQYFGKKQVLTDELLAFIKKYKDEFDLKKITLAGGDPMTRNDIIHLVHEIKKMNLEIYMDTVGKNFINDSDIIFKASGRAKYVNPKVFKGKISKIGIPLDGYTTKQINYFRRGITLDEIISILYVLNAYKYNICINTVVNQANIRDLSKMLDIIKQFENINQWQLFQYSPIGDLGYKNRKLFEVENLLFEEQITELILNNNSPNIEIEGKSNSYRKLNYLLVNSNGDVWQPKYSIDKSTFEYADSNSDKIVIGTIFDNNIIDKIKIFLGKINQNIDVISNPSTKVLKKNYIQ